MSQDILKVDIENLDAKAGEVDNKAEDYLSKYTNLYTEVDEFVSSYYQGEEGTAFKEQIQGFEDDFKKMKTLMNEYAQFMRDAAKSYQDTKHTNINTIRGLQN